MAVHVGDARSERLRKPSVPAILEIGSIQAINFSSEPPAGPSGELTKDVVHFVRRRTCNGGCMGRLSVLMTCVNCCWGVWWTVGIPALCHLRHYWLDTRMAKKMTVRFCRSPDGAISMRGLGVLGKVWQEIVSRMEREDQKGKCD